MKMPPDVLKSLSPRDLDALYSIYQHRCLSLSQIYEIHYMYSLRGGDTQIVSDIPCKKKLKEFENMKLIKKEAYLNSEVYFLTPKGVDIVVRSNNLPANIYDDNKNVVRRGYYTARELEIFPKYIPHQMNLNQFVLDFKKLNVDMPWKYYDEKYVSQYTQIRPDGMIQLLDTDFFLEMDMSTESQKQLNGKWINYRNFLNSREYSMNERKIVVLFIIESAIKDEGRDDQVLKEKTIQRIALVKRTISDMLMDILYQKGSNFDIYVGTKEDILDVMIKKIIPLSKGNYDWDIRIKNALINRHQFSVASGEALRSSLKKELTRKNKQGDISEYGMYIRKVEVSDGNIVYENGRLQEFLFDEYSFSPASVLSKIAYHDKNNSYIKAGFEREMSYIVLAESIEQIYKDVKRIDQLNTKNIYFTTLERLETMDFCKALFQIDWLGNVHRFVNNGLNQREFEINVRD